MENIKRSGRFLFAITIAVFGIQHFITGNFLNTLLPVPVLIPGRLFWVYLMGTLLMVSGISVILKRKARTVSTFLGILFFLLMLLLHLPLLISNPYNGGEWTGALELLLLSGGAFIVAGTFPVASHSHLWNKVIGTGRFLFAVPFIIIGLQHYIYAVYVAQIVPSWMPQRLFLTYLTGTSLIAAGISFFINKLVRLAASLLATMFLIFLVLLHIPRVLANMDNANEWTSAFIALAVLGISLILAANYSLQKPRS